MLGGPQASGFVCGRCDLIMSVALQHLDLDISDDLWSPPPSLIDRRQLRGLPQHRIGRSRKAGKEEIVGLLTALRLFAAEEDAVRHRRWLARLRPIAEALDGIAGMAWRIEQEADTGAIPVLVISIEGRDIRAIMHDLIGGTPSIHVDASRRQARTLVVNPVCFGDDAIPALAAALRRHLGA